MLLTSQLSVKIHSLRKHQHLNSWYYERKVLHDIYRQVNRDIYRERSVCFPPLTLSLICSWKFLSCFTKLRSVASFLNTFDIFVVVQNPHFPTVYIALCNRLSKRSYSSVQLKAEEQERACLCSGHYSPGSSRWAPSHLLAAPSSGSPFFSFVIFATVSPSHPQ